MSFEKIDSSICDESANHAEQFELVVDPSIGEQEVRYVHSYSYSYSIDVVMYRLLKIGNLFELISFLLVKE